MKSIKTRLLALLLSCCLAMVGTVTPCRQAQAAEVVVGMETARWIISIAASAGFTVELAHLVGKSRDEVKDWDKYDWGNLLDDPATQKQIDEADKKIEDYYNNAVKDWYVKHGGQLSPSPAPTTTPQPPVTVAPIDPDTVEPPIDWDTLKKNTEKTGVLSMMGATLACMRDGLAKFWDSTIAEDIVLSDEKNKYSYKDLIGIYKQNYSGEWQGKYKRDITVYVYDWQHVLSSIRVVPRLNKKTGITYNTFYKPSGCELSYPVGYFLIDKETNLSTGKTTVDKYCSSSSFVPYSDPVEGTVDDFNVSYSFYVPVIDSSGNVLEDAKPRPAGKAAIIPDLTRKQAYDNNASIGDSTSSGSGSSPGNDTDNPFNFKIPTIDEIKDFLKDLMGGDEGDQPTKVTNFITNHTVQSTPAPNPTTAPSPGGGEGGGGTTDPDNPDPDDTDLDNYKADLRDVFPFCIPFDLIHLLNVLDAEPEAPVFKIPIDLEAGNPFTGDKIVDYHSEMVIDLSDYDDAIKVIRILEIIAFLLGLMLITRQQMIKG